MHIIDTHTMITMKKMMVAQSTATTTKTTTTNRKKPYCSRTLSSSSSSSGGCNPHHRRQNKGGGGVTQYSRRGSGSHYIARAEKGGESFHTSTVGYVEPPGGNTRSESSSIQCTFSIGALQSGIALNCGGEKPSLLQSSSGVGSTHSSSQVLQVQLVPAPSSRGTTTPVGEGGKNSSCSPSSTPGLGPAQNSTIGSSVRSPSNNSPEQEEEESVNREAPISNRRLQATSGVSSGVFPTAQGLTTRRTSLSSPSPSMSSLQCSGIGTTAAVCISTPGTFVKAMQKKAADDSSAVLGAQEEEGKGILMKDNVDYSKRNASLRTCDFTKFEKHTCSSTSYFEDEAPTIVGVTSFKKTPAATNLASSSSEEGYSNSSPMQRMALSTSTTQTSVADSMYTKNVIDTTNPTNKCYVDEHEMTTHDYYNITGACDQSKTDDSNYGNIQKVSESHRRNAKAANGNTIQDNHYDYTAKACITNGVTKGIKPMLKSMSSLFWILLLVSCLLIQECSSLHYKKKSDEEKLLDRLFRDYNPSARPVLNSSKTVTVDIQFSLLQIQELNVRSQVLTTTGLLILDWIDERLTWTEADSSLDQIVFDAKNIWKPEFAVINGAEAIYQDYSEFQAVLYPSGNVKWEPGGVFKTMCSIDITYYPFDEQRCELIFGAWSYYTSKMNLTTNTTSINLDTYEKNGEWQIITTEVNRKEFWFECCPDQRFSNVAFVVYLRRRHTFYIMNVILPGILTSAVLLSIFFCTPQQKVHIGVAALLSFRLFLLNVADTIPRTSDHVPLLGVYLTCTMAITTLAMVATVFVLNLYGMKEKPVPLWAKKVFTIYVARLLCMCDCGAVSSVSQSEESGTRGGGGGGGGGHHHHHHNETRLNNKHKYRIVTHGHAHSPIEVDESIPLKGRGDIGWRGRVNHGDMSVEISSQPQTPQPNLMQQLGQTRFMPAEKKQEEKKPDYAKDWVHVAAVFDRLFFWLCLIFILITTLILFHPLTTAKYFNKPENVDQAR